MPEHTLLARACYRGLGCELVSDRGLSHRFEAVWFLDDSINKMGGGKMVIFSLSRSLEVIFLFTQLRVPADFLKGRLLKVFLTKRFSKLIRKSTH